MRSMVEGADWQGRMAVRTFQPNLRRARKLRRDLSLPEVLLWDCLRGNRLDGLRFRRQHPVGPYVLDFYCPAARLAVEVDGIQHDHPGQMAHDKRRDGWLREQGIQVMRIAATDVLNDQALEGVLMMISEAAAVPPPPPPSAVPLPRFAGEDQS
jgi:very-short-patch-repair endonuclease